MLGVFALHEESLRLQCLRRDFQEALIRSSGHYNVNIIIPWDKALMPDCTKQCPRIKLKRNIILLAYIRESVQKYFQRILMLRQTRSRSAFFLAVIFIVPVR